MNKLNIFLNISKDTAHLTHRRTKKKPSFLMAYPV